MITRAEYLALRTLSDGEWHKGKTTVEPGYVQASVAAALWREKLAERRGASRTASPSNQGFEYLITGRGREMMRRYLESRREEQQPVASSRGIAGAPNGSDTRSLPASLDVRARLALAITEHRAANGATHHDLSTVAIGARRLVREVWLLVDSGAIDARSPAADAALDLRDSIDPSWHPSAASS